jgi:integrase
MKERGFGRVFQPAYRDKKTSEKKISSVWWISYWYRGKNYRENSGSSNRSDAVKLLKKRHAEMGAGRLVGPNAERLTFEDMAAMILDDYRVNARKSIERTECSIKHLREFFSLDHALDITTDRVKTYIMDRQEAGAMPATVQLELAALKRMFTLAIQAGRLNQRPYIPSLKISNVRQGFFEEREFRSVWVNLPDYLQPPVEFAYLTGWRKGEIYSLQWSQVDFEEGTVRLEPGSTKNDEGREFPFSALPRLASLLREQKERTEALERAQNRIIPWVFHHAGEPIRYFLKAWNRACELAGVPGRIPHDFRRTAVRNLEKAGVPRSVAMKLTGHKTEVVYRRYAIVAKADLREGVEKLAASSLSFSREPAKFQQSQKVFSIKNNKKKKKMS